MSFPRGTMVKNPPADTGNAGSMPRSGGSPEVENGIPILRYSCLENPMGRGAWRTIVHGVIKSQT